MTPLQELLTSTLRQRLWQQLGRWTWLIHPVVALSLIAIVLLTGYYIGYQAAVDGGQTPPQRVCQPHQASTSDK